MSSEPAVPVAQQYGSAEHAAREALNESIYSSGGYVSAFAAEVADVVVEGLRSRGFMVTKEPRCECGWTGERNHMHDMRMGRANAN